MTLAAIFAGVALAGFLCAGVLLTRPARSRALAPDARIALIVAFGVSGLYALVEFVTASALMAASGTLEAMLRVAIPFAWGGALYACVQGEIRSTLRRRETELEANERRFREFTAATADWEWETDADGRFTFISDRVIPLLGIQPESFIGQSRTEFGDFDDDAGALAAHLADLDARRPFRDFRYRRRLPDGGDEWYEVSGRPMFDAGGAFRGYQGVARLVTREVEAMRALQESEQRFRNLVEGSIQGIYVHRNYKPLFVNRAMAEMLGFASTEAYLAQSNIEEAIVPEDRARLRGYRDARIRGEPAPAVYEYAAIRRDDGRRIVLQNAARAILWDGEPAILSAVVDVTERHDAEARSRAEMRLTETAMESLPGVFYLFDADGHFLRWNRNLETVSGHPPEDIAQMSPLEFIHEDDRALTQARIEQTLETGEAILEARFLTLDGPRPYLLTGRRVVLDGVACLVGTGTDLSALREVEAALRVSESRFRALYDDNPSMYMSIDADGIIRSINRYGAGQLGHDVASLVGTPAEQLCPEEDRAELRGHLAQCFAAIGKVCRWELRRQRRDGERFWVRETARAVHDSDGAPTLLVVAEDISETRSLSDRLAHEASHDGLTDLINRREFEHRLSRILKAMGTDEDEHALCYLDLDQFKVVNDTCGHVAGDELLRQLGPVLKRCIRQRDTLARIGGDEFAVLMEHCRAPQALRAAQTLGREIEAFRFLWKDYSFKLSASIGVVPIVGQGLGVTEVLQRADTACYVAKEQGRNRVHVYHEDDVEVARRAGEMQWVARLDAALEQQRFHLVRQPIVAVGDTPPAGEYFEVLLRMVDDDGEVVSPGAFLPAAERYNVASRLDRWVVDAVLERLARGDAGAPGLYLCNINLSGQSLADEAFRDHLVARVAASGVPPSKLCFEITETATIANFSAASRFIEEVRALGCRFALDDFGSGLSSFGYLKTLPVDFLKIDGVFTRGMAEDAIDFEMVRAINRVGKVLGKRTIAEFVEDETILRRLTEIGVDYAQGYHLGRPQPFD